MKRFSPLSVVVASSLALMLALAQFARADGGSGNPNDDDDPEVTAPSVPPVFPPPFNLPIRVGGGDDPRFASNGPAPAPTPAPTGNPDDPAWKGTIGRYADDDQAE